MMVYHAYFIALVAVVAAVIILGFPKLGEGRRAFAVMAFAGAILFGYPTYVELQGRPRPIAFDLFTAQEQQIIAYSFVEGEAIFLWTAGQPEPMSWRLPWNDEQARRLHGLSERAKEGGGKVMLRPREGLKSPHMFYRTEVQPLPPKEGGDDA